MTKTTMRATVVTMITITTTPCRAQGPEYGGGFFRAARVASRGSVGGGKGGGGGGGGGDPRNLCPFLTFSPHKLPFDSGRYDKGEGEKKRTTERERERERERTTASLKR